MQEQALAALEHIDVADTAGIALFESDWHQGVVGIVASRIKEKLHRRCSPSPAPTRRPPTAAASCGVGPLDSRPAPARCARPRLQTGAGLAQEIRWPRRGGRRHHRRSRLPAL